MFSIQQLTHEGWVNQGNHANRENAFWHARLKMDSTGSTHRIVNSDKSEICIMTASASTWCSTANNDLY